MTKEKKIKILEQAIELIKLHHHWGMCRAINECLMDEREYFDVYDDEGLPYFGITKPLNAGGMYWFDFSEHGQSARIKLLTEAIERLKK